jgi:hypothetical protein
VVQQAAAAHVICEWCLGRVGGHDPVDEPDFATHVVGGVPMCQEHAVAEVTLLITSPETFVHSWPGPGDDIDCVPFRFEVELLAPLTSSLQLGGRDG